MLRRWPSFYDALDRQTATSYFEDMNYKQSVLVLGLLLTTSGGGFACV